MKPNQNSLRLKLLLGTALVGLGSMASPLAAQVVDRADLTRVRTPATPYVDATVPANNAAVDAILEVTTNVAGDVTTFDVNQETVVAEWSSFNVTVGNTLLVNNGSGAAVATLLNRVVGGPSSDLGGRITANDVNFWLINQSGIVFGEDSNISANSLVFSTLNTTDAEFFDFAADALVDGAVGPGTINFVGGDTALGMVPPEITGASMDARFITDGSLWFVSEAIDLDARFDSSNETVAFITARDTTVVFTPGSPLTVTVNAGSTLATADVAGTISGGFVTIVASRDAMMESLLNLDASITATVATATEDGVLLSAGSIESSGFVDISSNGNVSITGDFTGEGIDISAVGGNLPTGTVQTADLTATDGSITINATGPITAGAVSSTNGNVILESAVATGMTAIMTDSIGVTGGGVINIDGTAGGDLNLGDITSAGGGSVNFDTTGTLTLDQVSIDSDFRIGRTNDPSTLVLNGTITALSFAYETANPFISQGITATAGRIDIDAASINTTGQDLNAAGGRVELVAEGDISIGAITSNGTGSRIDIDSEMGGNVTVGNLESAGAITLDTTGALITGSINDGAMNDTTVERLTIGGAASPSMVTINGDAAADSVTITSEGNITTQAVSSLLAGRDVRIVSNTGSIDSNAISADRSAVLTAGDSIDFTSVTAGTNATITATDAINGVSVTAGNNADLDAEGMLTVTGAIQAGNQINATSGDAMSLGSAIADTDNNGTGSVILTTENMGASLDVNGPSQGVRVTINSTGTANLGSVTSTGSTVDIDAAGDITTESLSATGGNVTVTSATGSIMTTGSIMSDANVLLNADSAMSTLTVTGAVSAAGNVIANSDGDLTLGSALADSDDSGAGSLILTTTAADGSIAVMGSSQGFGVDVDSTDAASFGAVTTTGSRIEINAVNDITATGALTASNGDIRLTSTAGSIDSADITSGVNVMLSAVDAMASIDAGVVTAAGNITATSGDELMLDGALADSDGSGAGSVTLTSGGDLSVGGPTSADQVTINSGGSAMLQTVTTTGSLIDIDAVNNINTGVLSATGGDIRIDSTDGSITTGDATSDGNVLLNANDDISTLAVSADSNATLIAGGSVGFTSVNAGGLATLTATMNDIDGGDVTAGSDATLTAGGMIEAGAVEANGNVTATATGTLTLESATADADGSGAGNLTLTSTDGPIELGEAVESSGVRVTITSGGSADLGDVRSTNGRLFIEAENDVETGDVTATGGNAQLMSITGGISTGDVTSDTDNVLMTADSTISSEIVDAQLNATLTGSDINYDSVTAGNNANLTATNDIIGGDITAGNSVTLTAGGMIDSEAITADTNITATADGDMELFSAIADNDGMGGGVLTLTTTTGSLTVEDASSGIRATISSGDEASLGDVTSTGGIIDIDAQNAVSTGNLMATGGDVRVDSANASIAAQDASSTANVLMNAATIITASDVNADRNATLNAGASIDIDSVDAGANSTLDAGTSIDVGMASATADVVLNAGGDIVYGTATAGDDALLTAGGSIEGGSAMAGDLAALTADTSIDVTDIDAGGDAVLSAGTSIDFDSVTAGANASLDAGSLIDGGPVDAGRDATLTAATSITSTDITAGNNAMLTAGDAIDYSSVDAGDDATLNAGGSLTGGPVSAGNDATLAAGIMGSITSTDITAGNDTSLTAGQAVGYSSVDAGNDASLNAGTSINGGMVTAGNNAALTAGDAIGYASVDAGNDAVLDAGGSINGGTVDAGNNATLTAGMMGSITSTDITAGNDASLTAGQAIGYSSVDAGNDASLDAGTSINGEAVTAGNNASLAAVDSITATDVTADVDATLTAGDDINFSSVIAGNNVTLTTTMGSITGDAGTVTAGNNAMLTAGDMIEAGTIEANGGIIATSTGTLTLENALADADDSGAGNLMLTSTDGPLTVMDMSQGVAVDITSGGGAELGDVTSTGGLLSIVAENDLSTGDVRATGGNAELTSATGDIATGDVISADNNVLMNASGTITSEIVDAGMDAALTASGVGFDNVLAGNDATLTATNDIMGGDITAGNNADLAAGGMIEAEAVSAGNDLTATSGTDMTLASATADADMSGAGDLSLASTQGPLTVTSESSGVSVTVNSGGTVSLGDAMSTTTATNGDVSVDAAGDVTLGATNASANILVGTQTTPSNVTFVGSSTAGGAITVTTPGTLSVGDMTQPGTLNAGTEFTSTSADVNINGTLSATNSATLSVSGEGPVQLGDQAGMAGFTLSEAEVNSIETADLLIDAGGRDITFSGLDFDALAGGSSAVFATTGDIDFTGSLSGTGAGRLFRFGGTPQIAGPEPTLAELANSIEMDIEAASAGLDPATGVTLNFAGADLELRANRIVFGTDALITEVEGLAVEQIANQIVGNAGSTLYRAGPDYTGPDNYLAVGNLNVVYQDAALFQNSGEVSSAIVETQGAIISDTLTLNPITSGPNAFGLFGSVNNAVAEQAALVGPAVIIQQSAEQVQDFSSRINGCIIGSGAGCLNTIVGITVVEISPEQLDLLTAEDEILQPFDPLVGTNNEGLFSDVEPDCERDEEGACVQ